MNSVGLLGELDPIFAWDGRTCIRRRPSVRRLRRRRLYVGRPPACCPLEDEQTARLLCDPLGINKLLWALDGNGDVVVASRAHRLVDGRPSSRRSGPYHGGPSWTSRRSANLVARRSCPRRDFNVHARLVNAALAKAIAEASRREAADDGARSRPVLVLTGDLVTEFLVDYQAEHHRGAISYGLPRLPPAALRTTLARGLDTNNREISVFGAWGLLVVQPYAAAVDDFVSISVDVLAVLDAKHRLGRAVFGDQLPADAYDRPKTRAQVGGAGADGGVLAACVDDRGVDSARLRAGFAKLHDVADEAILDRFIRSGMYRAGVH